ncbi:MAG: hypothetical protein MPW14_15460 [Candidatus Manganitrophus sp.]|nr:MAG: hypothetical protein MPW14_15460 [Candidatus Manganitrophus sp.]
MGAQKKVAGDGADRQQGDLVVECDERFDDHTAALGPRGRRCAYSQAFRRSASERTTDCPLPEDVITGFTTQG